MKRLIDKVRKGEAQLFCVRFNKRAAARGTRFIEFDVRDGPARDLQTLHVLAADINHVTCLGVKSDRRALVRKCFHFVKLSAESRLSKACAIARCADCADLRTLGKSVNEFEHFRNEFWQRIAFIVAVPIGENLAIVIN